MGDSCEVHGQPLTRKESVFTKAQEAACKDIARVFGVLQERFVIVQGPTRFWNTKTLENIMKRCVILHNMILEDERGLNFPCFFDNVGTRVQPERNLSHLQAFLQTHWEIKDANTHNQLLNDLVEHH
jgi:hypothetical protein